MLTRPYADPVLFHPPTVRPWLLTAAVCCALFCLTALLFSRGLGYDFTNYDDPSYVTNNPYVKAGFTWESVVWAFTGRADYWHPLTWLSHMLDGEVYGDNAAGHRLTNVLWHALNAVLAFVVIRRLTGAYWLSAFAAALFAWHPLRVESVIWVTERKDVMSGCFFLLTIWAYARYVERSDPARPLAPASCQTMTQLRHGFAWRPGAAAYGLTLALFLGGLMCKPMLVTLPAFLLLLDVWPLRRIAVDSVNRETWTRVLALVREKIPLFALSLGISVVTVLMQQDKGAFVLDLSLGARIANALVSVARYVGKFFWPFDLAVAYPHPGSWPFAAVFGATVLVIAITAFAWWQRRHLPQVLVGWLGFLVLLLPAIGLVQVGFQAMADRYTYVPVLALQLALLWPLARFTRQPAGRGALAAIGTFALVGCAARAWDQQYVWRDPIALFRHALAVTERNEVAHALLGYSLLTHGRLNEAAEQAELATKIDPKNEVALFTLASVHERRGAFDAAVAGYRELLELNPEDHDTRYQLGLLLLRIGRREEARPHLQAAAAVQPALVDHHVESGLSHVMAGRPKLGLSQLEIALALDQKHADAHFGTGLALLGLGRTEDAIREYRRTLQLQPDHPRAHTALGLLLLDLNETEEAETHFRAALERQPDLAAAHVGLGRALERLGHAAEAAASFERALDHAPDDPAAHRALGQSLARRHQFDAAVDHYRRALELQSNDASLHAELGYALVLSGRRDDGVRAWEKALELDPSLPGLRERLQRLRGR